MSKKTAKEKRSPLDKKPLHNPGESSQEELERLLDEEMLAPFIYALTIVLFAAIEWARWYFRWPPEPISVTALALIFSSYAAYKFYTTRARYRALRLGMEGEKFVGQFLEQLRQQDSRVFHDLTGKGFNVDHVVVSPRGIYVIETKTYSKPARGQTIVDFDGETILVNGIEPDRNAIVQVRAQAHWLRNMLSESTNRVFPIKCVIVLPGWFVRTSPKTKSDVWVLNPKALSSYIQHEPIAIKDEDVALVSSRITLYMQNPDKTNN